MTNIIYTFSENDSDLKQMLDLQKRNLARNLEAEELIDQGFVTADHSLELLAEMNLEGPHVIAKLGDQIVGYALVMTERFKMRLPVLVPMFNEIAAAIYKGKLLATYRYFVMGQICIDKPYRGKGVFRGLYKTMRKRFESDYDLVVTEISLRNPRSIRAHEKVGFETVHRYTSEVDNEDWVIVVWDWSKQ
ncbi:MAG: GNAT family N-acetyltransferase [Cyclobacteriaceae bacterium]